MWFDRIQTRNQWESLERGPWFMGERPGAGRHEYMWTRGATRRWWEQSGVWVTGRIRWPRRLHWRSPSGSEFSFLPFSDVAKVHLKDVAWFKTGLYRFNPWRRMSDEALIVKYGFPIATSLFQWCALFIFFSHLLHYWVSTSKTPNLKTLTHECNLYTHSRATFYLNFKGGGNHICNRRVMTHES